MIGAGDAPAALGRVRLGRESQRVGEAGAQGGASVVAMPGELPPARPLVTGGAYVSTSQGHPGLESASPWIPTD